MKFMITFTAQPTEFKAAVSRFVDTGALPPQGVKMVGRWHGAAIGWLVAETDNVMKLYEWTARCSLSSRWCRCWKTLN